MEVKKNIEVKAGIFFHEFNSVIRIFMLPANGCLSVQWKKPGVIEADASNSFWTVNHKINFKF